MRFLVLTAGLRPSAAVASCTRWSGCVSIDNTNTCDRPSLDDDSATIAELSRDQRTYPPMIYKLTIDFKGNTLKES